MSCLSFLMSYHLHTMYTYMHVSYMCMTIYKDICIYFKCHIIYCTMFKMAIKFKLDEEVFHEVPEDS